MYAEKCYFVGWQVYQVKEGSPVAIGFSLEIYSWSKKTGAWWACVYFFKQNSRDYFFWSSLALWNFPYLLSGELPRSLNNTVVDGATSNKSHDLPGTAPEAFPFAHWLQGVTCLASWHSENALNVILMNTRRFQFFFNQVIFIENIFN